MKLQSQINSSQKNEKINPIKISQDSGLNLQNLFINIQNTFMDFKNSIDKLDKENENIFNLKNLIMSKKVYADDIKEKEEEQKILLSNFFFK